MTEPDHIRELRSVLRRFVLEKAPREKRREWDRTHTFPRDLFRELADLGLCGLTIPEEYGGTGPDILAAVAAIEELCRAGSFLAGPFIQCAFYGGMNILENGSADQKADLLPRLARGEMFFAYGLSEPDVGGDLSSVTTRARREGDAIVIDGAKRWCTGADFSDYIYCLVRSDPEAPARSGLSFVLIPTNAPGVTITPIDHVNLRYTLSSDVHFDEVRLPLSAIVGGPERWNQGWKMLAGRALDIEKLEISACAFGLAQAALEEAWAYAGERVQFGKPISGHQAVRHALVDAKTKLEACRLMLWNAARLADAGEPCAAETSMAKLFIAETGVEIVLACQKVMGAYAMSADYDIERNVRDLLGMPIVGGSSNMQRNNLAALWKLPRMTFNAVAAVQSLMDEVHRRAPEIESVRRLPADLAKSFADAGLFRMLLPVALGGHDTPPAQIALAIEGMAQADASAAWCLMIGATTGALANRLPAGVAREVFGDPGVIAAGVFAPMGKAVDDGDCWKVTGRWQWGSGSQNANWIAGGAMLMGADGPQTDEHGQPLHRMMIFRADEVQLIDTWRTAGLCGTGSLDFQVKDVRVPKARSVALQSDPPTVNTPLARFPVFGMLALGVTAVALGNARAALLTAGSAAQTKKASGSQRAMAERNVVQADFARAVARLSAARAHYFETIGVLWAAVQGGGEAPAEPRGRLRLACAHAVEVSADVCKVAYDMMGGAAVYLENDLQRRFRDAHVITHHAMVAPAVYELAGRVLLGLPTRADQL